MTGFSRPTCEPIFVNSGTNLSYLIPVFPFTAQKCERTCILTSRPRICIRVPVSNGDHTVRFGRGFYMFFRSENVQLGVSGNPTYLQQSSFEFNDIVRLLKSSGIAGVGVTRGGTRPPKKDFFFYLFKMQNFAI